MLFTVETAPPEILVETFADLLSDRFVFTPEYGSALDVLIYNLPNDDVNAIASSIKAWCQARPEIWAVLEDKLGKRRSAEPVPPLRPTDYQAFLKSRLQENFLELAQQELGSTQYKLKAEG